jgi:predicted DNA-binding antitoxin AbrB/MazE fold protein
MNMATRTKAIYEEGILKPLEKLDLKEGEEVELELKERKAFSGKRDFLRYAGILKDLSEEEEKIFRAAVKRKSLFGRALKL